MATNSKIFGIALLLFLGAGAVAVGWVDPKEINQQREIAKIESRRDHFRISGEVEFDGERVVYDEIVQVRIDIGTISTMGLKKGDNRILISRRWVTRMLRGGGALRMEVPQAGGLFTDLERTDEPRDRAWTPSYVEEYLRPPEEYLPEFVWVDDPHRPTVIEGYFSEAYYAQPAARLRIIRPIRIDFVPPSTEAEMTATSQMEAEPRIDFNDPNGFAWKAMVGVPVSFSELNSLPEDTRDAVINLKASKQVLIPKEIGGALFDYARLVMHVAPNYRSHGYGIPQPRKYPDGKGILYGQAISPTSDAMIPLDCDTSSKICSIVRDQHGFAIFRRARFNDGSWKIRIGANEYILSGQGVIDTDNQRILMLGEMSF